MASLFYNHINQTNLKIILRVQVIKKKKKAKNSFVEIKLSILSSFKHVPYKQKYPAIIFNDLYLFVYVYTHVYTIKVFVYVCLCVHACTPARVWKPDINLSCLLHLPVPLDCGDRASQSDIHRFHRFVFLWDQK